MNTGLVPVVATITVTPQAIGCERGGGELHDHGESDADGDRPADQVVCNGAGTTLVSFSGTGTSYSWVNNTPGIGLAASGSGRHRELYGGETGLVPVVATITVTPQASGCDWVRGELHDHGESDADGDRSG